ncbi:MAG: hemolysin family protein [Ignavibacterium sp.]|nr:hemolysin family protein [Ignavibacterium sp.]
MDIERLFYLISLSILILLSGLFSASEVALFGLEKKRIINYFTESPNIQRYLNFLLSNSRRLLISILVGNNLVNVAASIVSVALVTDISYTYNLDFNLMIAIQIVTISTLILVFGELIPKMIATKYQFFLLRFISLPIYFFSVIIFPITEFLSELIRILTSKLKFNKSKYAVSSDDLADISQISDEKINLNKSEKAILESLSDFKDIYVFEIMTPRVDIVALSIKDDIDKAIQIITQSGHSRIPVYENSIDNVLGILHAKDLLKFIINPKLKADFNLKNLIKKPLYVPETKKIYDLLNEFQIKKNHIAIVVDEYGGTAGLITLEDIIEEVLGDIWDEFDKSELGIQKISEKEYIVNANLKFSDFESEMNIETNINDEIKDNSFAAIVLNNFGQIPEEGMFTILSNLKLTVLEVVKKRIRKVKVEILDN